MPRAIPQSARLFVIAVCAAVLAACAAPGAGDDTAAVNVPLTPLLAEMSPLHLAAKSGDCEEVVARIEAGDDVNARAGEWRYTPLHWAAEAEYGGCATHFLIEAGAYVNTQGKDGLTPLHLAARKGDWVAVSILISTGARINAQNHKKQTPLDLAKANGRRNDVVDELLKAGAVEGKK